MYENCGAGDGLEQRQQRSGTRVMVLGDTWGNINNVCAPMEELEVTMGNIISPAQEKSTIIKTVIIKTILYNIHHGLINFLTFFRVFMGVLTLGLGIA